MRNFELNEAKRNLERVLSQVLDDAEPATVVLKPGREVVVVPFAEYSAWQETRYLLSSPANAAHLRKSIAEAQLSATFGRELLSA